MSWFFVNLGAEDLYIIYLEPIRFFLSIRDSFFNIMEQFFLALKIIFLHLPQKFCNRYLLGLKTNKNTLKQNFLKNENK